MLCAAGAVSTGAKGAAGEDPSLGKTNLLTALQWSWGLPQNLMGGAMCLLLDVYKTERFHEAYVVYAKSFTLFGREMRGWVTLGNFVFDIDKRYESAEEYLTHLIEFYPNELQMYNEMLEYYKDDPTVTITPPLDPSTLSEAEIAALFREYNACESDNSFIHHEYGHTLQSAVLGPFYLPVIGVPSFLVSQDIVEISGSYYDFYTESWANDWSAAWLGKS